MVLVSAVLAFGIVLAQERPAMLEAVAAAEAALGWRSLFDGRSLDGWHPFGKLGATPEGWTVVEDTLHHPDGASGGDLVSNTAFGDFELEFEWRVAPGGNSGVKYRFADERRGARVLGPEYQLLDDAVHPDSARPETSAAALYALYPAADKVLNKAGEWNRARIVARGECLEHWLNGRRVLVAAVGSPD